MSIPENISPDYPTQLSFMFRCRCRAHPESCDENDDLGLLNCFVSFSQRSVDGAMFQQAVVLVSHWAVPQLSFQLLFRLDEAYFSGVVMRDQNSDVFVDRNKVLSGIADNAIAVAEIEFSSWPYPSLSGKPQELPFLGESIQCTLPVVSGYHVGLGMNFEGINLISLFGPLGLLQHIISLWALVITGETVLVLATSRSQCSEVAVALSTLARPMTYSGDLRPCIVSASSDCVTLGRHARDQERAASPKGRSKTKVKETAAFPPSSIWIGSIPEDLPATVNRDLKGLPRGMIIGTEDASLLKTFDRFTTVLFLPPPEIFLELDSLRKGLNKQSAADVSVLKEKDSFVKCMDDWIRYFRACYVIL